MFTAVLFRIAETWRQPGCSSAGEGPREVRHRRTAGTAQPERENATCSGASEGQTPRGVTHMWSLKKSYTNELIYKTERGLKY